MSSIRVGWLFVSEASNISDLEIKKNTKVLVSRRKREICVCSLMDQISI